MSNNPDERNPDCPECDEEMDEIKWGGGYIFICHHKDCKYNDPSEVERYNEGRIDPEEEDC